MSLFNFDHRTSKLVLASAALLLGGGLIGAGCGGTDTSTLSGFCEAQAIAECSYSVVQSCYGSNEASIDADTTTCIATRSQATKCNPKNLPYHPDFADNCIDTIANTYAQGQYDRAGADAIREACLPALNEGRQEGADCTDDVNCDVGAELRCITRVGGRGTCRRPVLVGGGASCKSPDAQCGPEQYCDAGFHCVQRGIADEACGAGQPCGAGYRCNELTQICEKQYANGQTCKLDSDCSGGFCLAVSGGSSQCSSTFQFGLGAPTCLAFIR